MFYDSKNFKAVTEAKPNGEQFTIKKKNVEQRMRSRLHNLKKPTKGLGGK